MESTLQGKNLLLQEQILFFKSWPLEKGGKKVEFLHLKVNHFALILFVKSYLLFASSTRAVAKSFVVPH